MRYKLLAEFFLEELIEIKGEREVAEDLFYNAGFSLEELAHLGFNEELIEEFKKIEKDELDDSEDRDYQAFKDGEMN
jgi:hypothetical protein